MASSSSSVQQKHEVFLSFRGEDTRCNFTSHLHWALKRKEIETFFDDQLVRGEEISRELMIAIEISKISIIVFSKNYASSSWCLEELCKIIECNKRNNQMIVPIFYHVDPSDVRNQTGSFEEAFAMHQERFKDRIHKVDRWRAALTKVGKLSGYHLRNYMLEAELVEVIVKFIWTNLNSKLSSDVEDLVGMGSHIEQLKELLDHMESDGVRSIGIWGMAGVGKTTTAEALFKRISSQFDASYFLADVREKSKRQGLECLRDEIFSAILKENRKIGTPSTKGTFIGRRLRHREVLIVLDDVDNPQQVERLIDDGSSYGPGSTIIITSRDKKVLEVKTNKIHTVEKLTEDQALELLSQYAFRGNRFLSIKQSMRSLIRLVHYVDGNPLALKILGSLLYNEEEETWDSALRSIKEAPMINEIDKVLRISYDELEVDQKRIFLDVACFFKGEDKNYVTNILDGCGFPTNLGLTVLIRKSLITILNNNLQMHNLIQAMGRTIVCQESIYLGARSRLWKYNDIDDVLTTNKATKTVEGIFLNMSKIEDPMCINPKAFLRMKHLRLLKIYNPQSQQDYKIHLPANGLEVLPDLVYLHWHCCPLKSLPLNPKNLVELHMHYSHVNRLWKGKLKLWNLKWIDLSYSQRLKEIPDLSKAPNLVRINLVGCTRLESVPELPPNLRYLDAHNCTLLKANSSSFPIGHGSCQRFIFTNCIKLDQNTMWSKIQLGIQQRATADDKLYHEDMKQDLKPRFSSICICFPGSEIPKWFDCQNLGSSVTTLLLPHLHDHKLVGFAVCAVVAFEDYNKDLGFTVKCQCNFKTTGDDCHDCISSLSVWDKSDSPRFIGSDHVFFGYDFNLYSDWYIGDSESLLSEVSFEFFACDSDSGNPLDSCIFKKCGVRLLYAQDDSSEIEKHAEGCNPLMNLIQPNSPYNPHFLTNGITSKIFRDNYCQDEAEPSGNFSFVEEEVGCCRLLKFILFGHHNSYFIS